jgi:hypothetical protein
MLLSLICSLGTESLLDVLMNRYDVLNLDLDLLRVS